MSHWKPVGRMQNLINILGGEEKIACIESGELVVVERSALAALSSINNGGISPYVSAPVLNIEAFIADWREFYRQVHSMKVNPPLLKCLPRVTPGFNWGALVPKSVKPQRAYEMDQSMFPCWKWCGDRSLDKVIDFTKEARTADRQSYIVYCEDSVEPPARLANTSALQIAERQVNTLGLTETLLLHGWFYWKSGGKSNGKHLDVRNWTLCSASRYSGGSVPGVHWGGSYGELRVRRCDPGDSDPSVRSREAVS